MSRPLSEADIAAFRDRMCDIAEAKFVEFGPKNVTMRMLAAAMGVSSMTPYRYFRDKDEILIAVRTRAFHRLADAMEQAEDKLRDSGSVQPGEAYFEWAVANANAYRLMFSGDLPTTFADPQLRMAMKRAKHTMSAGWKRLRDKGLFHGDVEETAHMCWTATHGAVILELSGMLQKPMEARDIVMRTIGAIAKGVNAPVLTK